MNRLASYLDRVVDLGLIVLLCFTSLAFGAVEDWARAIAQSVAMLIFVAWALRLTWTPALVGIRARNPTRDAGRSLRWFGERIQLSGLEAPALLLALVVGFQLVPLPPSWVRVISPRTAEIFTQSLPGYGAAAEPSFSDLPRWLAESSEAEVGGVPVLPAAPDVAASALPAQVFAHAHPAWRPLSLTPAATQRGLQIFLAHLAVFVVVFNWVDSRARATRYLYLLAGLAGLLSVLAILQHFTAGGRLYWLRTVTSGSEPFGPFVSRNNFAGWTAMVLPMCAGLTAMVWHSHEVRGSARRERQPAFLLLLGFITVFGVAAFLLARSRGGLLSLAAAVGVYAALVLLRERPRPRTVMLLVLIIGTSITLAAWMGGTELWSRYETLGNVGEEPSFRFRVATTGHTLAMAKDFPLLGTGFGSFEQAFYLYSPGTSYKTLRRAHNDYAELVAESGLLGAIAMVWGLVVLVRRGLGPGLLRRGIAFRWPIRGIAVGVLALLFHSFVDFNLQIYSNSILFVFLTALLLRGRPGGLRDVTT